MDINLAPLQIMKIRVALGMNRTQFGATLGVSESAVHRWESGKTHPRYDMMQKINGLSKKIKGGFQPVGV